MGQQHAAHRRRRASDVKPHAVALRVGRNPADRIGCGGIENGTAVKSITNALRVSAVLSSTVPTADAAPKKNAPEMRYTNTSGSAAMPAS